MRDVIFYLTAPIFMGFFGWLTFVGASEGLHLSGTFAFIVAAVVGIACGYAYSKIICKEK